ncbi:MAG: hypothetical protein P4L33_01050 [Capsulimonadaceae bacterium]|nr:hypothetical protein [Capsulimonadaceae bacterium]
MVDIELARWMSIQRKKLGLRQSDMAALVGAALHTISINQARISEWERGLKPVPAYIVPILRQVLA